MMNQFRFSYKELAPHKFMPMLGVHKSIECAREKHGLDAQKTRATHFNRYASMVN